MQVNNISNKNNTSFGKLTLTKDARAIVSKMNEPDKKEFMTIARSISDTVHWNLRLKADTLNTDKFSCSFVNKHNPKDIFPGGYWIYNINGNRVSIASLSTKGKTRYEDLIFPNEERVKSMINMDNEHTSIILSRKEDNPILSRIKRLAQQLRFLDEAYEYKIKNDVQ